VWPALQADALREQLAHPACAILGTDGRPLVPTLAVPPAETHADHLAGPPGLVDTNLSVSS
jgi:hypothetical protein